MISPTMFAHNFPFDPTYGYTKDSLLAVKPPAIPEGFESFWRRNYELALSRPTNPAIRRIDCAKPEVELYQIEYDGFDGFRVGGWYTRPAGKTVTRGLVIGHGYGGRENPDLVAPGPDAVTIQPCARGFHRSSRPDLPAGSTGHVILGIEDPQTYIHRHCVMDLFSAVSAMIELDPQVAQRVDYLGGSFGGGIGAMALPWEKRFVRAALGVPSFGHHDIRLRLPCVGSGESVRQLYLKKPEIRETLYFFDSAVSAQFCKIPVMCACALFDPAVPPPGQFAVYNGLAGEKHLFTREGDHFEHPRFVPEGAALWREQDRWFRL